MQLIELAARYCATNVLKIPAHFFQSDTGDKASFKSLRPSVRECLVSCANKIKFGSKTIKKGHKIPPAIAREYVCFPMECVILLCVYVDLFQDVNEQDTNYIRIYSLLFVPTSCSCNLLGGACRPGGE